MTSDHSRLQLSTLATLQDALRWCHTCGRSFNWRPSMSADWTNVKYCSKTCRSKKPHANRLDRGIERSFLVLLLKSDADVSTPSQGTTTSTRPVTNIDFTKKITCEQVQERDGGERTDVTWRERYRRAARRLANVHRLCNIEHCEKGNNQWTVGDGKGVMRISAREDSSNAIAEHFKNLDET